MPTYKCPNHPDCQITCTGTGYAYYVEPYGPCRKGCDPVTAGTELRDLLIGVQRRTKFSGIVQGITGGVLAQFASDLAEHAPSESSDDLAVLQRLAIIQTETRYDASWSRASIGEVIHALAEAASNDEPDQQALSA